jgi:hypothetical protein
MYIMPNVALKVHLFKNRFLKFVENILRFGDAQWAEKQNIVGSHWEPFWRFCSVCHPQLMQISSSNSRTSAMISNGGTFKPFLEKLCLV